MIAESAPRRRRPWPWPTINARGDVDLAHAVLPFRAWTPAERAAYARAEDSEWAEGVPIGHAGLLVEDTD